MNAAPGEVALRLVPPSDVRAHRGPVVPPDILEGAARIVEEVRTGGEEAVRGFAQRFDGLPPEAPLALSTAQLDEACRDLDPADVAVLERTRDRIAAFAEAQKASASPIRLPVEGGIAGDRIEPVAVAGCYAPGGLYPLPSSVLMTAVTARVAGVDQVWVACPNPAPAVQAAAAVAGADGLLVLGGAHAIAALAYGVGPVPPCDVVVGPGNHWVTAAKLLLSGVVGIDLLAGPSELVVMAGSDADPGLIAADLLAQAEHDPTAVPILLTTSRSLWDDVHKQLAEQIRDLPTADVAAESIGRGFGVVEEDADRLIECCERLAPEHLQLHGRTAERWSDRLSVFGSLFIGSGTAEVFGDYGFGPNHTLPTGGTARFASGLSVFSFLRRPTWLDLELPIGRQAVQDVVRLARMEGLEAHARAAEYRLSESG